MLDVSTTGAAQAHLRDVRAAEEQGIRERALADWRRSRMLPVWLGEHAADTAAGRAKARAGRMSVTGVEALLVRAAYDESIRRIARTVKRLPDRERGRKPTDERQISGYLGSTCATG